MLFDVSQASRLDVNQMIDTYNPSLSIFLYVYKLYILSLTMLDAVLSSNNCLSFIGT